MSYILSRKIYGKNIKYIYIIYKIQDILFHARGPLLQYNLHKFT